MAHLRCVLIGVALLVISAAMAIWIYGKQRETYEDLISNSIDICIQSGVDSWITELDVAFIDRDTFRNSAQHKFLKDHWVDAEKRYLATLRSPIPLHVKFYCAFVLSEFGTSEAEEIRKELDSIGPMTEQSLPLARGLAGYLHTIIED